MEDAAAFEISRQWNTNVGVIDEAEILWFGRIGGADLAGIDLEFGLAQAALCDEFLSVSLVRDGHHERIAPRRQLASRHCESDTWRRAATRQNPSKR